MRIYIIDDYWETRRVIEDCLRVAGIDAEYKQANNGKELMELISAEGYPDLLILDIMMPVMDGLEALKALKGNNGGQGFPIIVITALTEQSQIKSCYELGASDVIIKPFSAETLAAKAQRLLLDHIKIKALQFDNIVVMSKIVESRDGLDADHITRVSEYSFKTAVQLGLDRDTCLSIRHGSKIHDIGKIIIPDRILQKPDTLNEEEFKLVQTHTTKGAEIMAGCQHNGILRTTMEIIHNHHERWDGTGYPRGLVKDEIPVVARVVTVADVFDALTSKRVYKKAWRLKDAIQYIVSEKNKRFDPEAVGAFLEVVQYIY